MKPSRAVGVKLPYLLIPISDECNLGGIAKMIQSAEI